MACSQQQKMTQSELVQRVIANPALFAALVNSGSLAGSSVDNLLSTSDGGVTALMPVKISSDAIASQLDGKPADQLLMTIGLFIKNLEPVLEKRLRQHLEIQYIEKNLELLEKLEAKKNLPHCDEMKGQLQECIRRSLSSFCPPKSQDC